MAGRKSRQQPVHRIRRNKRKSAQKRKIPNSPQSRATFGQLVARGVRNITSCIWGTGLALKFVDFGLHLFGITSEPKITSGAFEATDMTFVGAGGKILLKYVNLLTPSKAGVRLGQGFTPDGNKLAQLFSCDYTEARIKSLTISVMPTGPASRRCGEWTIAFTPFYDASDINFWLAERVVPDENSIKLMTYATTSAASRPLRLNIRPRATDGYFNLFHPLSSAFGCLCVRFDQPARSTYVQFTPDDLAFDCVVSGDVELRRPYTQGKGHDFIADYVEDVLAGTGITFIAIKDKSVVTSGTAVKIVDDAEHRCCTASGTVIKKYSMATGAASKWTLSDMELGD